MAAAALGKFGLIADIQYVDAEDGTDFTGVQVRRYRHSLEVLKTAVDKWSQGDGVNFVAQLGDIIDVKARDRKTKHKDIQTVMKELERCKSKGLVHIIGNHDLYCFKRAELAAVLNTSESRLSWHSFKPVLESPLRVIVLDSYDVSTIEGSSEQSTKEAFSFLSQYNPNDITKFGGDWSAGLKGLDKRFMPYNGLIGPEQLTWLKETLEAVEAAKESAVILCHAPICPGGCDPICLLWNFQDVLDVINNSGRVVAVFAGHDHDGGYKFEGGVHFLTFPSPLLCKEGELAFATVDILDEGLMFTGEGINLPDKLLMKFV